jgi:serine/threonine protein kinase/Tol biopolymer transport system component
MALSPGVRLGHYEVVSALGAGGMGEVYRARDARIERDVAVKVLPAALAENEDRLRRFEQEAQAAGRLNHPNVMTVHDVGRHEGLPYVVSELLEGETLRARLGGSPLPVRKATEIAVQIARGLAAAHEQGIVHRDLKPENVFVVKDGQVKILDFGLAKLTRGEAALAAESDLRTEAYGTDPGTVMGTVGYMSPEQVRGRPVDHRSDIFSLGAILYEMLSGKRAFARDSSVETLNAILKEDPPELSGTGRPLPPALDRIVRHCLEKSPDERFASARDLAFDLQSLSDVSASGPAIGARPGTRRRVVVGLVGIALVALGALPAFLLGNKAAGSEPTYSPLTFRRGRVGSAVFAPDGKTILYSAAWEAKPMEVFVTQPGSAESRPLGVPGGVAGLVGDEVAVFTSGDTLVKVPLGGGVPRPFLSDLNWAFTASDGSALGVVRRTLGRQRVEWPVGRVLYETPGEVGFPRASPGGDRVAFVNKLAAGFTDGRIAVVDSGGRRRDLTDERDDFSGVAWSADGREVWYTASFSGSMDCELRGVSLAGEDRLVTRLPGSLQLFDITREGRVLLGHEKRRFEMRGRLPGETAERDLSWFDRTYQEDLTADGRTMIFHESGRGGGPRQSAFLRPVDGSPAVRLGDGMALALSPDTRWVVGFPDNATSEVIPRIFLTPTGAGEPRPLPTGKIASYYDAFWFSDGERLLLAAEETGRPRRLFVQDLPDGEPKPITPEGVTTSANTISPDGEWVAARRFELGALVALYPVAGGEPRPIPGLQLRDTPLRWSGDGRSLFVRMAESERLPVRIVKLDLATGRREPWLTLAPPDPAGVGGIADIQLSADGRGYIYTYFRGLGDLYLVEGLR